VRDEFYIGYEPEMPALLAARIRATAIAIVALSVLLATVFVTAQNRFEEGRFDFGHPEMFEGQIVEHPFPALEVEDAGATRVYWLVGPGKHGASELVRGLDGGRVRLSGTPITRDDDRMIEVVPDSVVTRAVADASRTPLRTIGTTSLEGEIVDSKCYLGVMKPGRGPTHRDCAVRCLLGSIPPMLVTKEAGATRRIPLVVKDSAALRETLPFLAARPVRVRGTLLERGPQLFLSTETSMIEIVD
jgi:hypothetical protein